MNDGMRSFQFHQDDHDHHGSDDHQKVAGPSPLGFSMDAQVANCNLQLSGQSPPKPSRRSSRSRASKKTPTTLLNADAANFRALVQHFTGCPARDHASRTRTRTTAGPINLSFNSATSLSSSSSSSSSSSMAAATISYHHQHQSMYDVHQEQQQNQVISSSTDQAVMFSSSSLSTDNMENFDGFFSDDVPLTGYY